MSTEVAQPPRLGGRPRRSMGIGPGWPSMGGITFLMFIYLTISGVLLTWLGPFWWLTSPVGKAMKGSHYWSAQAFFFFLVLHLIRVWATGAFRGRRWLSWALGSTVLLLALGENLFV